MFGNVPQYGGSWTDTQIVTAVPANAPSGDVSVVNAATAQSNSVSLTVVYPNISGFGPSPGVAGQQLTITGTNFGSTPNYVQFGDILQYSTSSWSDSQIVTWVPSNALSGLVTVVNAGTAPSNAVSLSVVDPTITSLSSTTDVAGEQLTIFGTNFGSTANYILFGSILEYSIGSWSDTQIVTAIPSNAQSGSVSVVNAGGAQSNQMGVTVVYPAISSFSPTTGVAGEQLTIGGTNFGTTANFVLFGNTLQFLAGIWNDSQIVTAVPPNTPSGTVAVSVINAGAAQSASVNLSVVRPNISTLNTTAAVAGQQVTITGTHLGTTANYVLFGTVLQYSVSSWSDTQIVTWVPSNAPSGTVTVLSSTPAQRKATR